MVVVASAHASCYHLPLVFDHVPDGITLLALICIFILLWRIFMKLDEALALIDERTTALAADVATQSTRITTVIDALKSRGVELTEQETNEVTEVLAKFDGIKTSLEAVGADPKNPAGSETGGETQPAGEGGGE